MYSNAAPVTKAGIIPGDNGFSVTKSKIHESDKKILSPALSRGLSSLFLLCGKGFTSIVTKVTKFYIEIYKYKNIRGIKNLKFLKCAGYTRACACAREGGEGTVLNRALEKQIERQLREGVQKLGGIAYKWVCPGHRGVPDRIVLLPGGRIYFVELKAQDGTPSPQQLRMTHRLAGLGFSAGLVIGREGVKDFLQRIQREAKRGDA